jgi:signal transduction histidine kinase
VGYPINVTTWYDFNPVDSTQRTRRRSPGNGFGRHTGLGLFLSREILSITGITITETGEPGKGAVFT